MAAGDRLAQDVEPALELVLRQFLFALADEHLHVHRLGRLDRFTECRIVGRHGAPAEQRQPLARDHLGVDVTDDLPPVLLARHEQLADRVLPRLRQCESELGRLLGEELVRDLRQDAGAIAHARVGADRAAMLQIAENLQAVFDDLVRLAAFDVGDEADAAGILVERGVVEALHRRRAGIGAGMRERCAADPCRALEQHLALASLVHLALPGQRRSPPPAHLPHPQRPKRRRGQRATNLEKGSLARLNRPPWLLPLGATDVDPASKGRPRGRQPLGQHYCPKGQCQILPRYTRLVHAGIRGTAGFCGGAFSPRSSSGKKRTMRRTIAQCHCSAVGRRGAVELSFDPSPGSRQWVRRPGRQQPMPHPPATKRSMVDCFRAAAGP